MNFERMPRNGWKKPWEGYRSFRRSLARNKGENRRKNRGAIKWSSFSSVAG